MNDRLDQSLLDLCEYGQVKMKLLLRKGEIKF
jgi:hypothetical protein